VSLLPVGRPRFTARSLGRRFRFAVGERRGLALTCTLAVFQGIAQTLILRFQAGRPVFQFADTLFEVAGSEDRQRYPYLQRSANARFQLRQFPQKKCDPDAVQPISPTDPLNNDELCSLFVHGVFRGHFAICFSLRFDK